jgi:hypothetical protein
MASDTVVALAAAIPCLLPTASSRCSGHSNAMSRVARGWSIVPKTRRYPASPRSPQAASAAAASAPGSSNLRRPTVREAVAMGPT